MESLAFEKSDWYYNTAYSLTYQNPKQIVESPSWTKSQPQRSVQACRVHCLLIHAILNRYQILAPLTRQRKNVYLGRSCVTRSPAPAGVYRRLWKVYHHSGKLSERLPFTCLSVELNKIWLGQFPLVRDAAECSLHRRFIEPRLRRGPTGQKTIKGPLTGREHIQF